MKRFESALSILAFGMLLVAPAQRVAAEDARKPYVMVRTEERMVKSAHGTEYRVMISWPEGKVPAAGYPVVYVLDGDDLFPAVTSVLRIQAGTEKASKHNAITPGLVVAVGYPGESGRNLDYTPKAPKGKPETYRDGRPYRDQENGGADVFFDFLEKELKPAIEKDYKVDRTRQTLLGNGYSGLFTMHILYTHPEAFQTYIASSPSVWWNDRYIQQEEKAFTERLQTKPIKALLVMTVGSMEQSLTHHEASWPEEPREEHNLKITRRRMVDNTRELFWRLEALKPQGLDVVYKVFADESHKSVVPVAISHALPFVFPPVEEKGAKKE